MQNYFETNEMPLFTADFDYFRIPRQRWVGLLTRLKQMGLNSITIALPWGFHEPHRGNIDLNGLTHSRRNVVGLLKLCQTLRLTCLLKPGPYSYQGVLGNGLPVWLLNETNDFDTSLSTAVENWYVTLSKTLVGQQWPAGPIIALEVEWLPGTEVSKTFTDVKWRIWLRKKYHSIEILNEAYSTDYQTVNDVKFPSIGLATPIPSGMESSPLEKDAHDFLEKVRNDMRQAYSQTLMEAGWQIPIYPTAADLHPELPTIQNYSLLNGGDIPILEQGQAIILNFQRPIQVDPDPPEIGCQPVWAEGAPIRVDGSCRPQFWAIRQYLWQRLFSQSLRMQDESMLVSLPHDNLLITRPDSATLELDMPTELPLTAYRLHQNGRLWLDDYIKSTPSKLKGRYRADETDLVFLLNDSSAPLNGFLLLYLKNLLTAQIQIFSHAAKWATHLAQMLTLSHEDEPTFRGKVGRDLSEAEAVLQKATASIRELESGFATILGKSKPETISLGINNELPQKILYPTGISKLALRFLVTVGHACANIVPKLEMAVAVLQATLDKPLGFTVEQYQQSYETAIATAQTIRQSLGEMIAQLRLEIAMDSTPEDKTAWRIHDQVQEIAESMK